jgi:hypothetical protein
MGLGMKLILFWKWLPSAEWSHVEGDKVMVDNWLRACIGINGFEYKIEYKVRKV